MVFRREPIITFSPFVRETNLSSTNFKIDNISYVATTLNREHVVVRIIRNLSKYRSKLLVRRVIKAKLIQCRINWSLLLNETCHHIPIKNTIASDLGFRIDCAPIAR